MGRDVRVTASPAGCEVLERHNWQPQLRLLVQIKNFVLTGDWVALSLRFVTCNVDLPLRVCVGGKGCEEKNADILLLS